jgi:hypothetical protein
MISGFRREVDENCSLLGYYAQSNGNFYPTFMDNLSVPSSTLKMGPIGCPEKSVRNYHYSVSNNPEEHNSNMYMHLASSEIIHWKRGFSGMVISKYDIWLGNWKQYDDTVGQPCSIILNLYSMGVCSNLGRNTEYSDGPLRLCSVFVPKSACASRNNQQYSLICTTPLFYILAPTCFGSSLPSSGTFLDPSESLEIQIEWVAHKVWLRGLCAGLSWFRRNHDIRHAGHVITHYMIYHPLNLYLKQLSRI